MTKLLFDLSMLSHAFLKKGAMANLEKTPRISVRADLAGGYVDFGLEVD